MKAKIDPSYIENDRLIALAELERYKKAIEWLGDPKNDFRYSIKADRRVNVQDGLNYNGKNYPDLLTAIEVQYRA